MSAFASSSGEVNTDESSSNISFNTRGEISVYPIPSGPNDYNEDNSNDNSFESPLSRRPSCFDGTEHTG